MKQLTIKIEDEQMESLQKISEQLKIKSVSWLIRRAINVYLITLEKEGNL